MFVDDVFLWLSSPSETALVDHLNEELQRIYSWACMNRVIFDFRKFHLFDLGSRMSKESRINVRYGGEAPGWSVTARYLGVLIDRNLDFLPFLEEICSRFRGATWRVGNHADIVTGASPRTLEIIFSSWLLPILDYGCPVWIFRIKQCFHYSYPIMPHYSDVFF